MKDRWPGLSEALSLAESVRGLGGVIESLWPTHPFYRTWTITTVTEPEACTLCAPHASPKTSASRRKGSLPLLV